MAINNTVTDETLRELIEGDSIITIGDSSSGGGGSTQNGYSWNQYINPCRELKIFPDDYMNTEEQAYKTNLSEVVERFVDNMKESFGFDSYISSSLNPNGIYIFNSKIYGLGDFEDLVIPKYEVSTNLFSNMFSTEVLRFNNGVNNFYHDPFTIADESSCSNFIVTKIDWQKRGLVGVIASEPMEIAYFDCNNTPDIINRAGCLDIKDDIISLDKMLHDVKIYETLEEL